MLKSLGKGLLGEQNIWMVSKYLPSYYLVIAKRKVFLSSEKSGGTNEAVIYNMNMIIVATSESYYKDEISQSM